VQVPDTPEFAQCVATKRKAAPAPAKGQPEVTDGQLKQQCKTEYGQLRDRVLSFLIKSTWLDQEAAKQGVTVSDKEVQTELTAARKQNQLDTDAAWQKYLVGSGLTEADIVYQQRAGVLERKITEKVTKGQDKVTDAQIQAYYDKNKDRFAQPERRDVRVVLANTKAKADQAKTALQSGQSWNAVAKKYSIDPSSKNSGGQLTAVTKEQQEPALADAVFAAGKGKLSGPIKSQFGWYVFEVTKVTAKVQQSLAESKEAVRQQVIDERRNTTLTDFGKKYRERWKAATVCRKDFVVEDCDNAPKAKANTTSTPAGQTPAQTTEVP
jgi:foldase protein PrsA